MSWGVLAEKKKKKINFLITSSHPHCQAREEKGEKRRRKEKGKKKRENRLAFSRSGTGVVACGPFSPMRIVKGKRKGEEEGGKEKETIRYQSPCDSFRFAPTKEREKRRERMGRRKKRSRNSITAAKLLRASCVLKLPTSQSLSSSLLRGREEKRKRKRRGGK